MYPSSFYLFFHTKLVLAGATISVVCIHIPSLLLHLISFHRWYNVKGIHSLVVPCPKNVSRSLLSCPMLDQFSLAIMCSSSVSTCPLSFLPCSISFLLVVRCLKCAQCIRIVLPSTLWELTLLVNLYFALWFIFSVDN